MSTTTKTTIFYDSFKEALKTVLAQDSDKSVGALFQNNSRVLNPFDGRDQRRIVANFAGFTYMETMNAQQAAQIVTLLPKVPRDLQAVLFTIPRFLPQLAANGQAEAVATMIGSGPLTRDQKTTVLETPTVREALAGNGQQDALDNIRLDLGEISPDALRKPGRPADRLRRKLSFTASFSAE